MAIDIIDDGIRALQSLDDLGTPEENERAWRNMRFLEKKREKLWKRLGKRRISCA